MKPDNPTPTSICEMAEIMDRQLHGMLDVINELESKVMPISHPPHPIPEPSLDMMTSQVPVIQTLIPVSDLMNGVRRRLDDINQRIAIDSDIEKERTTAKGAMAEPALMGCTDR